MVEPEASDERVDQFIVYAGYGEVMHRFQTFELVLWQFLVRGIKPGSSPAQAMDKITEWDNTTAGAIVRDLKSQAHRPDGMSDSPGKRWTPGTTSLTTSCGSTSW